MDLFMSIVENRIAVMVGVVGSIIRKYSIGPMVYAAAYCPLSQTNILNTMGFADSKTLTEEQRDALFVKLNDASEMAGWTIDVLSPSFISKSMLRRVKYNLNHVSHDTAIGLIRRALDFGIKLTQVFIDTVGDPATYQKKLLEIFPTLEITVAKKADSTYPIVSAASICAKVARDGVVSRWKFSENTELSDMDYGSGYPADPKTKQFLATSIDPVFGFSQFVRFSWSTADIILRDKAVRVQWEDDEDENGTKSKKPDLKNVPSITSFFQAPSNSSTSGGNKQSQSAAAMHRFFTDCSLKRTLDLQ